MSVPGWGWGALSIQADPRQRFKVRTKESRMKEIKGMPPWKDCPVNYAAGVRFLAKVT